jgi:hypothetical protein
MRHHAQLAEKASAKIGSVQAPPLAQDIVHKIGIDLYTDAESAAAIDDPGDYIYSVQLIDEGGQFTGSLMEQRSKQLSRDRLTFSKTILKKYLREAVVRESTVASPWIVKPALAKRYGIPTAPNQATLQKNSVIKDQKLSKRRAAFNEEVAKRKKVDEEVTPTAPVVKKRKTKAEKEADTKKEESEAEEEQPKEKKKPIKFPIEDLEVDPASERELKAKIAGEEPRRRDRPAPSKELGISLTIFEPLMVTYHFLHAFGKPLMLAPFTLDDYEAALQHTSSDPCPLITEIHASLINIIVRDGPGIAKDGSTTLATSKGGAANGRASKERSLSPEEEDEDEESGDELEDSKEGSVDSDEEEEEEQNADESDVQESESEVIKTAISTGRGWDKKTLKLEDGRAGWENSLLGLLAKRAQPDLMPRMMGVLSHLTGKEHPDGLIGGVFLGETYFTAKERLPVMPVTDKLAVIHFLCDLAVMTKAIKNFFEECEATLTELRKERVELSRQRKKLIEERNADEKRKEAEANGGENGSGEQAGETGGAGSKTSSTSDMSPPPEDGEDGDEDEEEEDELQTSPEPEDNAASDAESVAASASNSRRALPSRQEALREKTLQRKAEEAARQAERARMLQEQKAKNAESKRLLAERNRMESEEERISAREEAIDLEFRRCFLAPRLRPLGKDRFHDKYWWFDGIGAQDLGVPGRVYYGAGRLFVQGCSEEDWRGMCEGRKEKNVIKRREIEHGEVVLEKEQWAVYDQPDQVSQAPPWASRRPLPLSDLIFFVLPLSHPAQIDQLIAWLRNKGNREYALKRSLGTFRNYLQPGMQRRLDDLAGAWKQDGAGGAGASNAQYETRRSSRKTAGGGAAGGGEVLPEHKYLTWSNTLATK